MSLYEKREARELKKKQAIDTARVESEKAQRMAGECFAKESGQFMLNYIMRKCGFEDLLTVIDGETREISPTSTVYNLGRRSVYLDLRSLLKPANSELLSEIERKDFKE